VGFLTLGLLIVANLTINSRLPPRKIEKIFDFRPLKELGFLLFVLGETVIMVSILLLYLQQLCTSAD